MSQIQSIPLNKLILSQINVRRTGRKDEIDALAASIAAHGLLQNLAVVAAGAKFEVVAGGRRLAALKLLAARGERAKNWPVPCQLIDASDAQEASLAENVQRSEMNAMDEVEAFAALIDAGAMADDIARRFGTTLRHVEQRLALARLSPTIRNAYRKGDVTLDVARAFCLSSDHSSQERVFKGLSKPITNAQTVRGALTQGRTPVTDRIARFVGTEAYEAAGGRVINDLFDESVAFLEDGDILQSLALAKAEQLSERALEEGWGWTHIELGHGQIEGCSGERLRPTPRKLKAREKRRLAQIEEELTRIEEELESNESGDDDASWERRDALECERSALLEAALVYDKALMAHAGVLIGIDRDGAALLTRGLIRRTDAKTIERLRRVSQAPNAASADEASDTQTSPAPRLPKALLRELTLVRTRAIRQTLIAAPQTALALVVWTLARQSTGEGRPAGVDIAAIAHAFDDEAALDLAKSAIPGLSQLHACFAADTSELLAALAVLAAETIDLKGTSRAV